MGPSNDLWADALSLLSPEDRQLIVSDEQDKSGVLTDLQRITEDAKTRSIEHRWRFRRPGRGEETVVLRDLFSKIVTWIDRFKEFGDIVVQYDPAHAALPWAGVRFLLQVVVSDIRKFDFVVEGAEKIACCISRFAIFENIYLHPSHTTTEGSRALEEAMTRLYASIFVYLAKAKKYYKQSATKRVLKAIVKPLEEFEGLLQDIETERTNVDRSASLVSAEKSNDITNRLQTLSTDQRDSHTQLLKLLARIDGPICRMNNQLDHLQDHLDHSKRIEILRWLSSQPYHDHHQQIKRQALKGSGQWLLQDPLYKQWRSDSVSSLLWLHGVPGSGKSTLVSIVIEDITETGQDPLPVYFYCTRNPAEPERSEPNAILASILRQLSCVEPEKALLTPVVEKYKRQGEGFDSRGPRLEESRDLVKALAEAYEVTTIIVDALDECDPETRQTLLDAFEEILRESAGLVKILISSRDDQEIAWQFRDSPNFNITSSLNIRDIKNYVRTETEKLVKKGRLLRHSRARNEMQELVIDRVSQGADGMFRWATLQLDVLCTLKVDDDVRENLGRLPSKLEDLYAEVYAKLTSHHGKSGRSIIENTFKWLLSAQRTLNACEFLWAIALNLDTPVEMESVLDLCHNLVIYDEGLNIFRFAHLSVREFLERKSEFSENSCNALTAENCLIHMMASNKSLNVPSTSWKSHIRNIRVRLTSAEPSTLAGFMDYSFDFWMAHCGLASRDARLGDSSFGQLFRFFLSEIPMRDSAFDEWVQRYINTFPTDGILKEGQPKTWWQLHGLFSRCPDTTLRIFFIAVAYGFSEITEPYLQNDRLGEKEVKQAVLLAAKAGQGEVFGLLMNTKNAELTSEVMLGLIESRSKETLEGLRRKVPSSCFTEQTCRTVIGTKDEWYLDWLLQQYPQLIVTEQMLTGAIDYGHKYAFELLFARTESNMPLGPVLKDAISRCALAEIDLILARAGSSCLNPNLMAYTAGDVHRLAIMEVLLAHGGASMICEDVIASAAGDESGRMLSLMLAHGGKITQTVLLKNASRVSAEVLDILLRHDCEINSEVLEACLHYKTKDGRFHALLSRVEDSVIAPEISRLLCTLAKKGRFGYGNWAFGEKSRMIRQLLDRSDKMSMDQDIIGLLRAVVDSGHGGADLMGRLLDRTDKAVIAAEITTLLLGLVSSIKSQDDVEMIRPLLDRAESSAITEDVLLAAVSSYRIDHILPMLLERAITTVITKDVLSQALQNLQSDVTWKVLARLKAIDITDDLLKTAAANRFCGDALVVISAITNPDKGKDVMVVLEKSFGPIELTEHTLLSLLRTDSINYILPERIKPANITGEVLIAAMESNADEARQAIMEGSNHVPITLDVFEAAIQWADTDSFIFLWNRAHPDEVPQTLIQAAAETSYYLFKFILAEDREIRPEESLLIAIAGQGENSIEMFELLLEQDIPLRITSNVMRAAVVAWTTNESSLWLSNRSPIQWLLNRSSGLEIADELFQMAAAAGRRGILESLARYSGMEDLPDEWLNIAKLRNAVRDHDNTTVGHLVNGGVDPNVADVDGRTPLCVAAYSGDKSVVRLLLSAGAEPDQVVNHDFNSVTPLHLCVKRGHYDIVKLLVEAGASIEFRDDDGQTPAMIAKSAVTQRYGDI